MANDLEQYSIDHSVKESSILKKIQKYTYKNEKAPQMITGAIVGNVLSLLIKSIQAKKILEIGMFTGYSAMTMAQALPDDGEIHTCEIMEEHVVTAKFFFAQSKHNDKIFIYQGKALETLESFKINSFDLAFIDADKINYLEYYKYCMHLVKKGGLIILDNMLWGGSVLNPQDDDAKKIRETGDFIHGDLRVENTLLPIRDGLMICIKK